VPAVRRPKRAEVTLVQRKDPIGAIAACEDDDRRVRQADAEIAVPSDDVTCLGDVTSGEWRKVVAPRGDLRKEGELRLQADSLGDQVVELCDNEGREDVGSLFGFQSEPCSRVPRLRLVHSVEEPTGVDEDQSSPKPPIASSQSVIGSNVRKSGSFGRGRTCSVV